MGSVHFISRRPRVSKCVVCHCNVLVGIAEGIPVQVDPIPITMTGEMFATIAGRATYAMTVSGQLYRRDAGRVRTDAKYKRPVVLAWHKCHEPLLSAIEMKYVSLVNQYMQRCLAKPDESDPNYEQAMFSIAELLSGRIIAVDDKNGTIPF